MKRLILMICLSIGILCVNDIFAQMACFNYRGEWSHWIYCPGKVYTNPQYSAITLKTDGGLAYFTFWITGYRTPTKDERKFHQKNDVWYEYTGWVEYTVNDDYPTAADLSKWKKFVLPEPRYDITPTVTRKTTCKIRIAPYKKHPEVYNVLFDNIAVAVSISGLKFNFK